MTSAEKTEYMRRWEKLHPGRNYAHVKQWRENLRKKLGEVAFLEWQRGEYQKYRGRILKGESQRRAKQDPLVKREKAAASWKTFKAKHGLDAVRAYRRKYYALNREHTLTRRRNTRNANPERTRLEYSKRTAIRRARQRAATIGDLTEIAKVYERRDWWRQWFDVSVDHTISLAKGGTHEPSNLQIIYLSENMKKHTDSDYKPKVIFT